MPWLNRSGIDLYFDSLPARRDTGAPPIVLGHSFLCSGAMWAPVLGALTERHRVINVDLRGHGQSGRALTRHTIEDLAGDVLCVLDHLHLERAILIGLSIGGMTAMRVAADHPARVAAMVLLDTDCAPEVKKKVVEYRALGKLAGKIPMKLLVSRVVPKMFGPTTLRTQRGLVAEWSRRWEHMDVASTVCVLDALVSRGDMRPRLKGVRCPTLVLHGAEDKAIPLARGMELADHIAGAAWSVVPDAGHLSTLEQPEAVASRIRPFLDALAP